MTDRITVKGRDGSFDAYDPGQHHAFSRHNGAYYNAEATALANARTSEFLRRHLQPVSVA